MLPRFLGKQLRDQSFCIKRGVLAGYRPLREKTRDGLDKFSSVAEGIFLTDIGFGPWKDRDLHTTLCDVRGREAKGAGGKALPSRGRKGQGHGPSPCAVGVLLVATKLYSKSPRCEPSS